MQEQSQDFGILKLSQIFLQRFDLLHPGLKVFTIEGQEKIGLIAGVFAGFAEVVQGMNVVRGQLVNRNLANRGCSNNSDNRGLSRSGRTSSSGRFAIRVQVG